jgi:hypothetical protein
MVDARSDWTFLDTWVVPSPPDAWAAIEPWVATAGRAARDRVAYLPQRLLDWEHRLAWLGGDPSSRDWSRFRPLRLDREEDWSDWFSELLQSSSSGVFAHRLLGPLFASAHPHSRAKPSVEREVSVLGGRRRADVVAVWQRGDRTHVEVKIWDRSFEKTFETARGLRETHSDCAWQDFILLPEESVDAWNELVDARDRADLTIFAVTWTDVVLALRQSLWLRSEDAMWSAWAAAFIGAIEYRLLGIDHLRLRHREISITDLASAARWLDVLDRGREEGKTDEQGD